MNRSTTTPPTSSSMSRRVGAALVAAAGLLHLVLVPEYLAEAPFIGLLFLTAAPLTGWAAWRLWRGDNLPAWLLGSAVSAGMIAGFVASRTVGLFGYSSADWAEGIPSLLVEAVFLVVAVSQVRGLLSRQPRRASARPAGLTGRR